MNNFWNLSNINLYRILCPPKIKDFAKKKGHVYSKEEVIYLDKSKDPIVYLVSSGKVKLVKYDSNGEEVVYHILTKGELFGEKLLLGGTTRSENAIACSENTTLCSMNLKGMKDLMRKNENFSTAIYKLIGFRISKIERRLELLIGKDVRTRLASFIYDLYLDNESLTIMNHLTQKEIGALLGASRESISKEFKFLTGQNIIQISRKEIIIKDLEGIKKLSDPRP